MIVSALRYSLESVCSLGKLSTLIHNVVMVLPNTLESNGCFSVEAFL